MNALHPIMQKALQPFAPQFDKAEALDAEAQLASILRLPFEVEIESRAAVTNGDPSVCGEAEYSLQRIDDDLVFEAADWLIDKHMDELERKALKLQQARWEDQA